MSLKSSDTAYGTVAVTIHWLSAALILILLGSGFRAANTLDPETKIEILGLHGSLGIAILVLTVARVIWWWLADRKPAPVSGISGIQRKGAKTVHLLFYIVIFGMAASGIGMLVLSGAGSMIFSGASGQLPDFQKFAPRVPHGLGARAMVLLLLFHAGAALYHHFFQKDGMLARMWFRR